jgi:hypothetical protein
MKSILGTAISMPLGSRKSVLLKGTASAVPLRRRVSAALAAEGILRPSRRKGVSLRRLTKTRRNRIPMDVRTTNFEVFSIADAVIGEASLPHRHLGIQAMRETSLDKPNDAFKRDGLRSEQKVDVVGHDNESVQLVVLSGPVVLESRDEEFSVGGNLEQAASVVSCGGDEECSGA